VIAEDFAKSILRKLDHEFLNTSPKDIMYITNSFVCTRVTLAFRFCYTCFEGKAQNRLDHFKTHWLHQALCEKHFL